jgi:hypothetical protein
MVTNHNPMDGHPNPFLLMKDSTSKVFAFDFNDAEDD